MRAEKTYRWRIHGPFELGGIIEAQGRTYILVATKDYVTKRGQLSKLLTWRGICTVCGSRFNFQTGKASFFPTATCERHRQGGGRRHA